VRKGAEGEDEDREREKEARLVTTHGRKGPIYNLAPGHSSPPCIWLIYSGLIACHRVNWLNGRTTEGGEWAEGQKGW